MEAGAGQVTEVVVAAVAALEVGAGQVVAAAVATKDGAGPVGTAVAVPEAGVGPVETVVAIRDGAGPVVAAAAVETKDGDGLVAIAVVIRDGDGLAVTVVAVPEAGVGPVATAVVVTRDGVGPAETVDKEDGRAAVEVQRVGDGLAMVPEVAPAQVDLKDGDGPVVRPKEALAVGAGPVEVAAVALEVGDGQVLEATVQEDLRVGVGHQAVAAVAAQADGDGPVMDPVVVVAALRPVDGVPPAGPVKETNQMNFTKILFTTLIGWILHPYSWFFLSLIQLSVSKA